jgi:4-hydroxyphenylacetate 3-monooxygenase
MLKSGKEHLEGLRDGRVVYIGNERVDDVTRHRAFRNAAHTVASIYDMKADPAVREVMSFAEDDNGEGGDGGTAGGERYSMYFLPARNREDLRRRMEAHRRIAALTYGMLGRSPDHVSSFVTGLAMVPSVFATSPQPFADNIVNYYRHMRERDIYAAYAVLPPQAARSPEYYQKLNLPIPTLQVVREDDDGVVISGMKMLATGAVFADEIWIGNLLPLAPDQVKQAITCAVPCNAPGLSLWSRQPFEPNAKNEFDSPLSWRFDESDAMVMCDAVKVPWERVFLVDDAVMAREIYLRTPAHCYGNHQSNVRFWSKLGLIVGLASRVAQSTGADQIPAVRDTLGRLAALEATLGAMIHGQIDAFEMWPEGCATPNRRYMYAALNWCTENHSMLIDLLRELSGGGVFQMPASVTVMHDPELRQLFETYWQTPQLKALDRIKLFKLVWDLVGSEFAGRHQQYEKFYAGASFIVRGYSYRHADWDEFHRVVDGLMASYDVPVKGD